MVSDENRTGLYVAVPVYFCMLGVATYWAYVRMEKMAQGGVSDQLAAHYLGGRDFGPVLTAGTLFASLFSGYTVVGIPNEAYQRGWSSLRWITAVSSIVAGYFGTGLRLRKASILRNHQSPVDFITDRYQSQILRYTVVTLQLLPSIIYLAAQVIAIKVTFNSIFELDPDESYPVIIIMAMILVFEWLGGLNSVALTDLFQAIVMVLSFIILPSVVLKEFGGWTDLDPETYPRPQSYQTLSKETQWDFWQFTLLNFGFFTLPHFVQRTYSAKDLRSLRAGYSIMALGPWFTSFVGVFLGTVGVAILADEDGNLTSPANPFGAIIEEIMKLGGFAKVTGTIAITASLAAIMSTADSLIIAISQLVTVDLIYPLRPNASTGEMTLVGKGVSLVAVVLSVVVGLFWDEGITELGSIQFALSLQCVPVFLIGLYSSNKKTDVHPWCLAAAGWAAFVFVFVFYFGYIKDNPDAIPINSGIIGFIIQLVIIVVLEAGRRLVVGESATKELVLAPSKKDDDLPKGGKCMQLLYPARPDWDVPLLSRFGERPLTPQLIKSSMEGVNEPLTNSWWLFMLLFVFSMVTPLTAELEPPLDTEGVTGSPYLYAPSVVNGIPWWAFKTIIMSIFPTAVLLVAINRMPDDFPVDEEKIEREGINVDLVEMTVEEMNKRESYDATNTYIRQRRSSIAETMQELGLLDQTEPLQFAPTPRHRKLAELALQSSRRLSVLEPSQPLDVLQEDAVVNQKNVGDEDEIER